MRATNAVRVAESEQERAMQKADHAVTHYVTAPDKWPQGLKPAADVVDGLGISLERLEALTAEGYMPHYRIDGGEPLYRQGEVRDWVRTNLMRRQAGRAYHVELNIHVDPEPAAIAPRSIANIPELTEFRLAAFPGVYFLVESETVVYVGQTVSPMARIGQHTLDSGGSWGKRFDRVFFVPVPRELLDKVEGALIRWLKPKYNKAQPALRNPGDDEHVLETIFRGPPTKHEAVEGLRA